MLVGPVFGQTTPHFPLYVVEAGLVELAALRGMSDRPLRFGALAGALIGTLGLAAEWGWSHLWMPLPWPGDLLPYAVPLGFAAAVAGGTIGALIGATLASDRIPRPRHAGAALLASAVVIAAVAGYGLHTSTARQASAQVTLTDVQGGPDRTVSARVALTPRDAADGAQWLTITAWQGGGFVLDRLERVGPGVFRSTKPIPVHGNWKALLRLHRGDSLQAVPIYLPRDPAIPARRGSRQAKLHPPVRGRQEAASARGARHIAVAQHDCLSERAVACTLAPRRDRARAAQAGVERPGGLARLSPAAPSARAALTRPALARSFGRHIRAAKSAGR